MQSKVAATSPQSVPGVTGVSYVLFGGNQNDPAIFAHNTTLNPPGEQDNFTTWALYYKDSTVASFTPGNVTGATENQNSVIEFSNNGDSENWFVIAQIPSDRAEHSANLNISFIKCLHLQT